MVASDGTHSVTNQVQVAAHVNAAIPQTATQTTQVSGISTIGDGGAITGFVVTFNRPLDPATAQDTRGYRILRSYTVTQGKGFLQSLFGQQAGSHTAYAPYRIASAVYDAQTDSVELTLATPMPTANGMRLLQVLTAGPHALRDARGRRIHGKTSGAFNYRFGMRVSKTIRYTTATGDKVALSLSGPGRIVSLLPSGSDSPVIFLRNTDPASSILTGHVHKGRKSRGYVVLDALNDTSRATIQLSDLFHENIRNTGAAAA